MSSGKAFLANLGAHATARLLSAGVVLELPPGATLIRRGEKGGDIYVVEAGSLEIVDDRFHPEVVLDLVHPGDLVGDMTFLDQEPRSADVRASSAARCVHIPRAALQALLEQDSEVSAAFFRALAERMAERHRNLTAAASLGALGRRRGPSGSSALPSLRQQAGEIAARARARWSQAAPARWTGSPEAANTEVEAATTALAEEASSWLERCGDGAEEAGALLADELHSAIATTSLGAMLGNGAGRGLQRDLRAWAIGEPGGEEEEVIRHRGSLERSFFGLATFVRLRRQQQQLRHQLEQLASQAPPTRSLLLSVNPEWLPAAALGQRLILGGAAAPADGAPATRIEAGLLALIQGRQRILLEAVDRVVIDGILEFLPDRWVVQALQWAAAQTRPGARLIVAQLPPTTEAPFVAEVLGWRGIRRSPDQLGSLLRAAGLQPQQVDGLLTAKIR